MDVWSISVESSWANHAHPAVRGRAPGPPRVADVGGDLHLDLQRELGRGSGLRASLTSALREAVRGGRLAPGTRLPSSRNLASDLGIARNTVAEAYSDLVAEGWLTARQGSGTRVAARAIGAETPTTPVPVKPVASALISAPRRSPAPRHDLMSGRPDASAFPRGSWLASTRRALNAAPASALTYSDPFGQPELRRALAGYLARARGVRTTPERVVICAGFSEILGIMGQLLPDSLAVEAYGLWLHREVLERGGLRTTPVAVDEHGARVDELAVLDASAVLLTPAHQFPTGAALHPERRTAVVDWARERGGLILEDDYDGEFRYDRQPVGAVQGLDPERVLYLGTASKSLVPGLRLAWMALPGRLVDAVRAVKTESRSSAIDQLALADFLDHGSYDRHVRAMRLRYRRRRDLLVRTLAEAAPERRVTGIAAGLHAVLELPAGTEESVVQAAAWRGLRIEGLAQFRHPSLAPSTTGFPTDALVIGYGAPTDRGLGPALAALCGVLP